MIVNNQIQSFKEYTKNICYEWVELEKIEEISSQNLIKMLQELQRIHNTTDLTISCEEVLDGYHSSTQIVISRLENAYEFNERIRGMYDYYVARENNARKKEQYEKQQELDKLMRKQQELQKQIDALK
jgi:hypothetical protein